MLLADVYHRLGPYVTRIRGRYLEAPIHSATLPIPGVLHDPVHQHAVETVHAARTIHRHPAVAAHLAVARTLQHTQLALNGEQNAHSPASACSAPETTRRI
jgi:hypothetical protein